MASFKNTQVISAQVLLHAASGNIVTGDTIITKENIQDYAPAHEIVALAQKSFLNAGFQVGNMVGISFSIAGSVRQFEDFFSTKLRQQKDGGFVALQDGKSVGREFPLHALPHSLRKLILTVTFESPADLIDQEQSFYL